MAAPDEEEEKKTTMTLSGNKHNDIKVIRVTTWNLLPVLQVRLANEIRSNHALETNKPLKLLI